MWHEAVTIPLQLSLFVHPVVPHPTWVLPHWAQPWQLGLTDGFFVPWFVGGVGWGGKGCKACDRIEFLGFHDVKTLLPCKRIRCRQQHYMIMIKLSNLNDMKHTHKKTILQSFNEHHNSINILKRHKQQSKLYNMSPWVDCIFGRWKSVRRMTYKRKAFSVWGLKGY